MPGFLRRGRGRPVRQTEILCIEMNIGYVDLTTLIHNPTIYESILVTAEAHGKNWKDSYDVAEWLFTPDYQGSIPIHNILLIPLAPVFPLDLAVAARFPTGNWRLSELRPARLRYKLSGPLAAVDQLLPPHMRQDCHTVDFYHAMISLPQ